MSQTEMIRQHLERGSTITPLKALHCFGCLRIGARIYELRQAGLNIRSELREVNGKRVAVYQIAEAKQ